MGKKGNMWTDYQIWDRIIKLSGYDNVLHQYRKMEHVLSMQSYALNLQTLPHWAEGPFGSVSHPDGDILCHSWCSCLSGIPSLAWEYMQLERLAIYRLSFSFYLVEIFGQKSRRFSFFCLPVVQQLVAEIVDCFRPQSRENQVSLTRKKWYRSLCSGVYQGMLDLEQDE